MSTEFGSADLCRDLRDDVLRLLLLLLLWPWSAQAHVSGHGSSDPSGWWVFDPFVLLSLFLTALLYIRGSLRLGRRFGSNRRMLRRRMALFWTGWMFLVIALVSPVDALGERLFSVHMIQHEILMLLAGPLLVLSRPGSHLVLGAKGVFAPLIRGINGGHRHSMVGFWRGLLMPVPAWILHFIGLWVWHVPALFNAGLKSASIHSLQHISFVVVALIFWYSLFHKRKENAMVAVVSLFTTAAHASLLGALLTFSPSVWYTAYLSTTQEWGLTPLQDQQLGGLIMWMPAGLVYVAVALFLLAQRLADSKVAGTTATG